MWPLKDSDRQYIKQSILRRYGSEPDFNEYVRSAVADEVARAMAGMDVRGI